MNLIEGTVRALAQQLHAEYTPIGSLLDELVYLQFIAFRCLSDLLSILFIWDYYINLFHLCYDLLIDWLRVWFIYFGTLLLFHGLYLLCCRRFKWYIYACTADNIYRWKVLNLVGSTQALISTQWTFITNVDTPSLYNLPSCFINISIHTFI